MRGGNDPYIPDNAIVVGDVEYWASLGNIAATQRAIQSGADVNASSDRNHTALHGAATNGHKDVVELLRDNGADPSAKLVTGETPADLARLAGFDDLAERLSR